MNLGNPGEFTIKELAETIVRQTKSTRKVTFLDLPGDDPKQRKPDITRAKKYLDGASYVRHFMSSQHEPR